MTTTLTQLIEEANYRSDKNNLIDLEEGKTKALYLRYVIELITQAFHAGKAKGRNDAVDEVWQIGEGDYKQGFSESAWKMMLTAARKGDKESGV